MKRLVAILTLNISAFLPVLSQITTDQYLQAAFEYTESQQYQKAINVCDKLIEMEPENANLYYLRGVNKYFLRDYGGAITDFDVTIKLNSNYTDAYLKRSKAKQKTNDIIGALMDLNSAKNENFFQTIRSLSSDFLKSLFREKDKN